MIAVHNFVLGKNISKMINSDKIAEIAKLKKEVSLKWVSESGEIICVDQAKITSFHGSGMTFNIMIFPSKEIRKVNRFTVIELNNEEVIL